MKKLLSDTLGGPTVSGKALSNNMVKFAKKVDIVNTIKETENM